MTWLIQISSPPRGSGSNLAESLRDDDTEEPEEVSRSSLPRSEVLAEIEGAVASINAALSTHRHIGTVETIDALQMV